jgi:hypothetical protein
MDHLGIYLVFQALKQNLKLNLVAPELAVNYQLLGYPVASWFEPFCSSPAGEPARKWLISARMAEINHPEHCNFFLAAEFK